MASLVTIVEPSNTYIIPSCITEEPDIDEVYDSIKSISYKLHDAFIDRL